MTDTPTRSVFLQGSLPLADLRAISPDNTNLKNMLLLIQLRWIAVIGQVMTIALVQWLLGIPLPLLPMSLMLLALVGLNLASYRWLRQRTAVSDRALIVALLLDVLALTVQLYFTGGTSNPFAGLYVLQTTLAAVLLTLPWAWGSVALTGVCMLLLTLFNVPLRLDDYDSQHIADLRLLGNLVCFVLDAGLLVFFVKRITRNLRQRDEHLAELKQSAAEEDHIVRMGLLASGAAHELGTPLASVAVILGDWQRIPEIRANKELMADIEDMQAAILRCKTIVTGILLSAGEARGDASAATTVHAFINETVQEWRTSRPSAKLEVINQFGEDVTIVSDSTLKQVIANLLDNAAEVSPNWIQLRLARQAKTLLLEVADVGNGFAPEMLKHFGQPYQSSKGRLGGGLGLFLVVNVVRKLGGSVTAHNELSGGARVLVTLPLDNLTFEVQA